MSSNGLINRMIRASIVGRGQGSDWSEFARPGVEEGASIFSVINLVPTIVLPRLGQLVNPYLIAAESQSITPCRNHCLSINPSIHESLPSTLTQCKGRRVIIQAMLAFVPSRQERRRSENDVIPFWNERVEPGYDWRSQSWKIVCALLTPEEREYFKLLSEEMCMDIKRKARFGP